MPDASTAAAPGAAAVQEELFSEPAVLARRQDTDPAREKRGRGRPKGSKNKRSQEWVQYILALYPSPLEAMAAVGAMQPEELLAAIGIRPAGWIDTAGKVIKTRSVREMAAKGVKAVRVGAGWTPIWENADLRWAYEKIAQAQKEATPYLHEKRGAVVEDESGNLVPALIYGVLQRPGGDARYEGGPVIDATPRNLRPQENQALMPPDPDQSTDVKSTMDAKSLNDKGE